MDRSVRQARQGAWGKRARWSLLSVGLLLAMVSSGTTVIFTGREARAASCLAESCEGLWPNTAGCITDQIYPVGELAIDWHVGAEGEVEAFVGTGKLYYSRTCRSSWAEFSMTVWNDKETNWSPQFQFWEQPQYGGRRRLVKGADPNTGEMVNFTRIGSTRTYRSAMASWNMSVEMCSFLTDPGELIDPDMGETGDACTGWL